MIKEWMNEREFVSLALRILGNSDWYEDSILSIRRGYNGLDLEIERKPMPNISEELGVSNPVTMVMGGNIIRHHGEHCYLTVHMMKLDLDRNKILE